MPLFWFSAGALSTLALLIVLLPWLRKMPRCSSLPVLPWQASVGAAVVLVALIGSSVWLGSPETNAPAGAFGSALTVFDKATGAAPMPVGMTSKNAAAGGKPAAESMNTAIANLEARLAKGGGSADDWELLAKSFEFLGRPADAAKARAHQLPSLTENPAAAAASPTAGSGMAVTGEVSLAPSLAGKAVTGETLFIVAKSVDSPGIPVAVYRGSVGKWPLKFRLDDSQSMMPGRNLSSAGRVRIEARISKNGQALPSAGDLQGSTGVFSPADQKPLKIVIDRVIS